MTPRRYQFDNPLPAPRESHLPVYQPQPMPGPVTYDQQPIVVQHIHQAPPDRTVQRVALGAGVGGGAVAAGVYFGPLLVAALSSMAISLAVVAFVVVAVGWGSVSLVRSLGGPDGKAAAQNVAKARRRG
ncbi:DUF6251 family protein [Streptomyces natalensis]|uniref:Uncharacterized protein n=1 Tax=Streptomyces natalensis ATCC 27448 TaxID=1240678 RepID=A0A0D7CQX8_9ACTN|nr:DUF6251 family protein [Streptomyces natalensis]KIZ18649.1 hypothetical protein SNA_08630 [Streptomyces natalensis ATCC 27448]